MAETIVATMIVGVMLVAALRAVGASASVQFAAADRARGRALAASLMAEIVQQKYSSTAPRGGTTGLIFGGGGGLQPGNRETFDDLDDYHGYADAPPLERDGCAIAGGAAYRRQVAVEKVNPYNLAQTSSSETGIKRITVTVTRNNLVVARLVAVRTNAS
jgi:hypothetical protein